MKIIAGVALGTTLLFLIAAGLELPYFDEKGLLGVPGSLAYAAGTKRAVLCLGAALWFVYGLGAGFLLAAFLADRSERGSAQEGW